MTTLVRVVIDLSLRYGVNTVLKFVTSATEGRMTLTIDGVEEVQYLSGSDDRLFRGLVLNVANSYMGTNVAMSQLVGKFDSRRTLRIHGREVFKGVAVLQTLVPELDAVFWVTSLQQAGSWIDSMAIELGDSRWVEAILKELLANRRKVVNIVYVLVRAAMELGHEAFAAYTTN